MDGKKLLFLDTETTGLDHTWHEIVDIWAAVVRYDNLEIIEEGGGLVTPIHIERANQAALKVNGYTPKKWIDSEPFSNVWDRISDMFQCKIWAGQNLDFDIKFIQMAVYENNYIFNHPNRKIDTLNFGKMLVDKKSIPNAKLDTLCKFLKIDSVSMWGLEPHGARADVYRTIEVYRILREVLR